MIDKNKISQNAFEHIELGVKWYNPEKGYGFLTQGDNLRDIMIHFSVLDQVGCPYVKEGDRLICDIAQGKQGLHVVRVLEITFGSSEPRTLHGFCGSQLAPLDPKTLEDVEGVIKWYNPDKGYGFILPDDGRKEIFLHYSVVRVAGYKSLEPGTRVLAKVATSERGQEARILVVLSEAGEKQQQVS